MVTRVLALSSHVSLLVKSVQSFVGKWKDTSAEAENLAEYLKVIGLSAGAIEAACKSVAYTEWKVDGENITCVYESDFRPGNPTTVTFQLGQSFDEQTMAGRSLKTTYTEEGGKIVKKQVGEPYNCTITSELKEPNLMIETMVCESDPPIKCTRKLRKQ